MSATPPDKTARNLMDDLRSYLHPLATREVFLAATGFKVSRTCLDPALTTRLLDCARRFGFFVRLSERKIVHRKDLGKGGWSNTLQQTLPLNAEEGDFELFLANDEGLTARALEADRRHDDETLGKLLGIPDCCRQAYPDRARQACRKQNDFVPLVAAATMWPPPFDPATNYVAQYFGRSLLSHFPCSFRCPATRELSGRICAALAAIDPVFADGLREAQDSNILYTEYCGIISFPGSRTETAEGCVLLPYDRRRIEATAASPVVEAVRTGDKLMARAHNDINVCRGSETIARLFGDDFTLCLFR